MPVARVTMPDGSIARVEVPSKDVPKAQIVAEAKAAWYQRKAEQARAARKDVTTDMTGAQKFFAGMGKSIYDTARGVGNLVGLVSDEDIAHARELDAPLMNTGAGIAGNVVGHAGQVLAPGGLLTAGGKAVGSVRAANLGRELMAPTRFATGAGIGAGYNALQPGTTQERLAGAALGGAFGGVGGYVGGKLGLPRPEPVRARATLSATPTASVRGGGHNYGHAGYDPSAGLTEAQRAAMATGKGLGFKTTPGQASGSRALQQLEAKLESQPMTSGPFNAVKEHNASVMNRVAAASIGEQADNLSPSVLEAAKTRLSDFYKGLADDTVASVDADDFLETMYRVEDDFEGLLPGSILDNALVKRVLRMAEKGEATHRQLQSVGSKLGNAAHKAMTSQSGDRDLGLALYHVKHYVDDLLQTSLPADKAAQFTEVRNQYRNLMLLTQRSGVINPGTGNVHANALGGLLQQKDKAGYLFNKNQSDLYNAARFGQAFRPIVGDSGTATRSALPSATDVMVSAPSNLAVDMYLRYPRMTAYGGNVLGRAAPIAGNQFGGFVGRELY